jgi:hypothetical protein
MPNHPVSDPDRFPRAPSQERWLRLSEDERRAVVAALPNEVTDAEVSPPEGDLHFWGKVSAAQTLKDHFKRKGQVVYLACELPVYYPSEPRFAPDLLAVVGASDHERGKWVVSDEGSGLHVVLEVHVGGDRKKDAVDNVESYARLQIPEYFIFDRNLPALMGYRLLGKGKKYVPILPQQGRYRCEQLGLDLQVDDGKLRFFDGNALLLESAELAQRLERMVDELQARLEEETRRREDETKRREDETKRREDETKRREAAEQQVKELEAKLRQTR